MTNTTTDETVVGIFADRVQAEQAIRELYGAGFRADQVGLVGKNNVDADSISSSESAAAATGAATGVAVGAAGGAAVGAGIAAGVIPVIGPILAIGTLGTILLNAAGGAAVAGLAGALAGWGVAEDDASYYESEVQKGKYLVTVEAGGRLEEAKAILNNNSAVKRQPWRGQSMN